MFCKKCGTSLEPTTVFCPRCGTQAGTISSAYDKGASKNAVTQSSKPKSYYGLPLLINGILAGICGCIAMCIEAITSTNGATQYIEEQFFGYSKYGMLTATMEKITNICRIWAGIGIILVIFGIVFLILKQQKQNKIVTALLWILPMLVTIGMLIADIFVVNRVVTY